MSRFKRFLMGYDSVSQLAEAELKVMPYLMIQALIAEAAIPIGQTGNFARMDGLTFLKMVRRKVEWMEANAEQLSNTLDA
jgi:Ser/Thr protein kinase RdoA (MazF antagonist)